MRNEGRLEISDPVLPPDFWERVRPVDSGCWLWTGSLSHNGYALFRKWRAGRFVLSTLVGPPSESKPWALHSCDQRSCVNPSHLRWGSPQENTDDMFDRGRDFNGGRASAVSCKNGHDWSEYGFFVTGAGQKVCKECRRLSFAKWYYGTRKND